MSEYSLIGIIGVCIGSFLNVAILRLPHDKSVIFPSSHCPHCQKSLKWYHNIPLLSWLLLRGRCAFCHAPISYQYPLIELLSALLFILAFAKTQNLFEGFLIGLIFALLLALSLIDLRFKAVPDALSLPALVCALLLPPFPLALEYGLLFMGGFTFLRFSVSAVLKKEAMGEADSIIAGIMGAMLGIELGLFAIYLSAVLALIAFVLLRKKGYELPYIPFLSAALLITWIGAKWITPWLRGLYA